MCCGKITLTWPTTIIILQLVTYWKRTSILRRNKLSGSRESAWEYQEKEYSNFVVHLYIYILVDDVTTTIMTREYNKVMLYKKEYFFRDIFELIKIQIRHLAKSNSNSYTQTTATFLNCVKVIAILKTFILQKYVFFYWLITLQVNRA